MKEQMKPIRQKIQAKQILIFDFLNKHKCVTLST